MNITSLMKITGLFAGVFLQLTSVEVAAQGAPGVTEDTITVGLLGSLTGPSAFWGTINRAAAELAFEEANAAGGVYGRKIK